MTLEIVFNRKIDSHIKNCPVSAHHMPAREFTEKVKTAEALNRVNQCKWPIRFPIDCDSVDWLPDKRNPLTSRPAANTDNAVSGH